MGKSLLGLMSLVIFEQRQDLLIRQYSFCEAPMLTRFTPIDLHAEARRLDRADHAVAFLG